MRICECGSRRFKLWAVWYGDMLIELTGDHDFEVVESDPGDSEFVTSAPVECVDCGKTIPFWEWDKPVDGTVEEGL